MKFRTKLLLTFLAIVLTINSASLFHFYRSTRAIMVDELRERVLALATGAAAMVDGELHATLAGPEDEGSPAYEALNEVLRRYRDANRRDDTYIRYIYTLVPTPGAPDVLRFVLDPEESTQDQSHVGDVLRQISGPAPRITAEAYADETFASDEWGTWLSAYAPVTNARGEVVAMLGVDIAAARIRAALVPLQLSAAVSTALAVLLTVAGGLGMSSRVSRPLLALRGTLARIGKGDLEATADVRSKDEFGEMAEAVNLMTAGLREREAVKSAFARYVSNQVLDSILQDGGRPHVHGDRRRVTLLFSDIRGFTSIAEGRPPEEVVGILNEYFARMVDIVFAHKGTLDKFMGDGLMVMFGAPVDDPEQELNAVLAASEMQREVRALGDRLEAEGVGRFRIGIGINTGDAIVGNIGSEARLEYTAVGDTVNLASRLESATKDLGEEILISEETWKAVQGRVSAEPRGELTVRGRVEPVRIYSVSATASPALAAALAAPSDVTAEAAPSLR